MDDATKQLMGDCLLRPVAEARSTPAAVLHSASATQPPSRSALKTELQVLRLSDDGQASVLETLRFVHGQDFQLPTRAAYKDKGGRMRGAYWQERGQLVIRGGCDYSNVARSGCEATDRHRMFALLKLESYGFHKAHCAEALEVCEGDVDQALNLLFGRYFPVAKAKAPANEANDAPSADELRQMRTDEIEAIESIYEQAFEEEVENRVWLLKLRIDHLLKHSPHEQKKRLAEAGQAKAAEAAARKRAAIKRSSDPCRNAQRGKCKYGDNCRYSHTSTAAASAAVANGSRSADADNDPNWFYLELRFPEHNRYPLEAPMLFVKTTCPDIPSMLCLRITRRLLAEARTNAVDQMPTLFSCADLLQQDAEISEFLRSDRHQFPDAKRSLFDEDDADALNGNDELSGRPSHYVRAAAKRSGTARVSREQQRADDAAIVEAFGRKQTERAYLDMQKVRAGLPAWRMRETIVETVRRSPVVVISGETGCGKSTQVPQFFLDDWLHAQKAQAAQPIAAQSAPAETSGRNRRGSGRAKTAGPVGHCEVICTQPRRISAISVAERVAAERAERIGATVGYSIRLENRVSKCTRLTFCTTGILLRRLQSDPLLESVSHVVVDEVHERSEESDFLLLILKEILAKRSDLRVILMSATLNANLFAGYFDNVPVLEIPGRTFPVEQFFLEDLLDLTGFVLEPDSQYCRKLKKNEEQQLINELEFADVRAANAKPAKFARDEDLGLAEIYARYSENTKATCKTLFLSDPMRINPELIEHLLRYVDAGTNAQFPREGTILVFLPGLAEIQTVHDALSDSSVFGPRAGKYVLVPLHSTLTNEEQALVFQKAPKGKRKIVLSTNIAETSVTIDDCVIVIDVGQMKEKRFDGNRNMESLDLVWVSRANAMQRKGRAGRVMKGVSMHLYTRHRYTHHFIAQPIPEIHRIPLEQLLLRIKTLPTFQKRRLAEVASSLIEPPVDEAVQSAVARLQDVGAFDASERLTALGEHLSALPVDVRIGKLMLFGAIFQCVDSVLTMAACLSYKTPFVSSFARRQQADAKKKDMAIGNSDQLTVLNAYRKWTAATQRSRHAGQRFANDNCLSTKTLETLVEIKQQFLELLQSIGFVPGDIGRIRQGRYRDTIAELTGPELNQNGDNNRLLAALLCAALYPNVLKVLTPEKSFTMSAGGAVPREPLPSELRFKTGQDGYVFLHPSSVNAKVGHFSSPFIVFQEKVRTSKIYIRECTMVPLLPLVLFSGNELKVELHAGEFVLLLRDEWIMMQAATHEVAEMVKCLRAELVQLLSEKIADPSLNLLHHANGRRIIATIVQLISKE